MGGPRLMRSGRAGRRTQEGPALVRRLPTTLVIKIVRKPPDQVGFAVHPFDPPAPIAIPL